MRRVLLVVALLLAAPATRAAEVLVHAAASLADALRDLGARHEAATSVRVTVNSAASNVLARQIVEGAPGDVFFSADEARMDQVEKAGLVAPGTRVSLLSNSLVVVVAADSPLRLRSAAELADPDVRSVALADPTSVPAGIHSKDYLRGLGAWEGVLPKVVPTENVRGALAAVESGNVDAAIVYATDARSSRRARVEVAVPACEGPLITHPACRLASSKSPAQADAFLAYLKSFEAAAVFREHGFVVTAR